MLSQLGVEGKRLKKNAKGEVVSFSFRHFAHLILIDEGKIQARTAPLETGIPTKRTEDLSAFKFVLTGNDDQELENAPPPPKVAQLKRAHQLEILDRQIGEVDAAIAKVLAGADELKDQQQRLSAAISTEIDQFDEFGSDYRDLSAKRRSLRRERENLNDRVEEIELLLARFAQLNDHYASDKDRLESIEEAGSFFVLRDQDVCPLCGAAPEHHRTGQACDGDIDAIRTAAKKEMDNIALLQKELAQVVDGLGAETRTIETKLPEVERALRLVDEGIRKELPDVRAAKTRIDSLVSSRDEVQKTLQLHDRRGELYSLRGEISDDSTDATALIAQAVIDGPSKDAFALQVQNLLNEWGYPTDDRVFLDLKTRDIEIAGKLRASNGKGVRAVLHAAFTIGLAKYCHDRKLPHPGFVVLDSPLVTYRDPLEEDEKRLASSDLKSLFFQSLEKVGKDIQIIIFENVDLPDWLTRKDTTTVFTRNPNFGRAGFYPR